MASNSFDRAIEHAMTEGVPCARGCGQRFYAGWATLNHQEMKDHDAFCLRNPDNLQARIQRAADRLRTGPTRYVGVDTHTIAESESQKDGAASVGQPHMQKVDASAALRERIVKLQQRCSEPYEMTNPTNMHEALAILAEFVRTEERAGAANDEGSP